MITKVSALAIAIFLFSGIAHAAATATCSAIAWWDSFSVTGTSVGWSDQFSNSSGDAWVVINWEQAGRDQHSETEPGWVGTSVTCTVDTPAADSAVTAATTSERVSAEAVAGAFIGESEAEATAGAQRKASLTALADGTLTISVRYTVDMELVTTLQYEHAIGIAFVELTLVNSIKPTDFWSYDDCTLNESVSDGATFGPTTLTGTLQVSMDFRAGETGGFELNAASYADAYTPAPEPAALGLIGIGLLAMRKRRS